MVGSLERAETPLERNDWLLCRNGPSTSVRDNGS